MRPALALAAALACSSGASAGAPAREARVVLSAPLAPLSPAIGAPRLEIAPALPEAAASEASAALEGLAAQAQQDVAEAAGLAFDGARPLEAASPVSGARGLSRAVAPLVSIYRRFLATPERVPFVPAREVGTYYYHGTSWTDVMSMVDSGAALAPRVSYLAREPHQSEPYARARARLKKSKSIVLEFEDVGELAAYSGSPAGQYPAYRARSPIPLAALTAASKKAVLEEYERQGGSREGRDALLRALGL